VRKSYTSEKDFRWIRFNAITFSLVLHLGIFFGLLLFEHNVGRISSLQELTFGSSGGGGGEGAQDDMIQFGPQGTTLATDEKADERGAQLNLIRIHVYEENLNAIPVPVKEEPKPPSRGKRKPKAVIAENLPTRWIRRGTGPGSGGGAGGGSGGGIGKGSGYSIDWGGTGSRRLLSGRLPKYPEGTDKQMAVTLKFSVLPDGTVDAIIPDRKTDELLERAAISALRTWRFDPLPQEIAQESQVGKVTFNFKLE